jgi:hypothetical protein
MIGGLHLEKTIISVLRDILHWSGWVKALTEAGITSSVQLSHLL